jgi:ABC-type uncharacterized transport system permease subunit
MEKLITFYKDNKDRSLIIAGCIVSIGVLYATFAGWQMMWQYPSMKWGVIIIGIIPMMISVGKFFIEEFTEEPDEKFHHVKIRDLETNSEFNNLNFLGKFRVMMKKMPKITYVVVHVIILSFFLIFVSTDGISIHQQNDVNQVLNELGIDMSQIR